MQQNADAYRSNPELKQQADEAMQKLLARSATDADFRHKLVNEPAAALAEYTGRDIAHFSGMNVRFIENKADATIVLPAAIDPSAELSESELEAVAGGASPLAIFIVTESFLLTMAVLEINNN